MYILGVCEYPSVAVRVDEVAKVPHKYGNSLVLDIRATVRFPSAKPSEVQLVLWAPLEAEKVVCAETEFVTREIILEGYGPHDEDNPYSRGSVGLKAIWFDDPDDEILGKQLTQVQHEAHLER